MFCNTNVQIYVRVGVFGVGNFDVWLRKMHVEGKRWEGAMNEIKKKRTHIEEAVYISASDSSAINQMSQIPRLCDRLQNFVLGYLPVSVKCCWK